MKRTRLTRKTPLKAKPIDYTDADGKQVPLRRSALSRGTKPLKAGKRRTRTPMPQVVRRAALARSRGRCVRCGERAQQVHHVLPVSRWPQHTIESLNLVGVCTDCHANHEVASRRLRLHELPRVVREWATGLEPDYMLRTYAQADAGRYPATEGDA